MQPQDLVILFRRGKIGRVDRLLSARPVRDAHILTVEGIPADAAFPELLAECFTGLPRFPALRLDLVDFLHESFGDRVVERRPVEGKTFRIVRFRLAAELRKLAVLRTVGIVSRDDFKLSAPGDARICHRIKRFLVFVEIHFIQQDVAAFAGKRQRIAGQRADPRAVREPDDERGDPVFFVHDLHIVALQSPRDGIRFPAPHRHVVGDKLFRRKRIARADPLHEIAAVFLAQTFPDRPVARAVGDPDTARLLIEFQRRFVIDPALLIRQEIPHVILRIFDPSPRRLVLNPRPEPVFPVRRSVPAVPLRGSSIRLRRFAAALHFRGVSA